MELTKAYFEKQFKSIDTRFKDDREYFDKKFKEERLHADKRLENSIEELARMVARGFDGTATKEDIKHMATKEDIKHMATKEDIKKLEERMDRFNQSLANIAWNIEQLTKHVEEFTAIVKKQEVQYIQLTMQYKELETRVAQLELARKAH